jgi:hypothetical protein
LASQFTFLAISGSRISECNYLSNAYHPREEKWTTSGNNVSWVNVKCVLNEFFNLHDKLLSYVSALDIS